MADSKTSIFKPLANFFEIEIKIYFYYINLYTNKIFL
nr:MAG TPA: hypothetical protein [Caudoviricetes sp.]